MKDLHFQRGSGDISKLFLRTGKDVHPFDDIGPVERMAVNQQSTLFVCGTHQKKRPDNVIFGRLFSDHILDLFEFGLFEYEPVQSFKPVDVNTMIKPVLVFQGEQFDFVSKHRRFKNYLIDFFKMVDYEEANIAELKRVMVFTAQGETKITFKQFEVNPGSEINQTDVKNETLKMNEIGPRFTLHWRRDKIGSDDLFKEACKQPKIRNMEMHKAKKNMFTDEFGQQMGKVFLQHQDLSTMATRKWKKQKPKAPVETADAE